MCFTLFSRIANISIYLSEGESVFLDDGYTHFSPQQGVEWPGKTQETVSKERARDRYLKMSPQQVARVQEALVQFVAAPPERLASRL